MCRFAFAAKKAKQFHAHAQIQRREPKNPATVDIAERQQQGRSTCLATSKPAFSLSNAGDTRRADPAVRKVEKSLAQVARLRQRLHRDDFQRATRVERAEKDADTASVVGSEAREESHVRATAQQNVSRNQPRHRYRRKLPPTQQPEQMRINAFHAFLG